MNTRHGSALLVLLVALGTAPLAAQSASRATSAPPASVISVGPNVQVSKPFPNLLHQESWAAGDPVHPGRLIACSQVEHEDQAARGQHCYASFDDGKTWSTILELDTGVMNADPYITYGRGDTVFIMTLSQPRHGEAGFKEQKRFTNVYRSVDGGHTWRKSSTFAFIDRESIVQDKTGGPYSGRIYINGVDNVRGFEGQQSSSLNLYRSTDGGTTFDGPVQLSTLDGGSLLGSSNSFILSDGTLVFMTAHIKKGRTQNLDDGDRTANVQVQLVSSSDGGETVNPAVTISEMYMDRITSEGALLGQLAVDPGSPYFRDRIYAVWPDMASGRVDIRFAYSTDKGKTWSAPIRVTDDKEPILKGHGPDHIVPAIAVNKAGAILVAWYDRRESGDDMSWRIRAAASVDGGVTFSPSTMVSSAANVYDDRTAWIQGSPSISGGGGRGGRGGGGRGGAAPGAPITVNLAITSFFLGGHTSGLAVDADGVFFPAWLDNRTGVGQIWTAPVTVNGAVEKNGAHELAELDDITDKVSLEAESTHFDRASNTLTFTAKLWNTSRQVVRAPLKLRLTSMTSQLGTPSVVNAENGMSGTGAIWDFSSLLSPAGLQPDSTSASQVMTFKLSDVHALQLVHQTPGFTNGLVRFAVRAYGKTTNAAVVP